MRYLGVDFGQRRIGLALSDGTGMLARPWQALPAGASAAASAAALARLLAEGEETAREVGAIVVGLPRRLGGEETHLTPAARAFADALRAATGLEVHLQDERLTSREAEQRLSVREPDWRMRKTKIDAVAAAIILQDFLDARVGPPAAEGASG